ncbi:tRNA1(Val) (adenine(37)-N6)-methyltransferase [Saccharicrinis aurantiacus]|uniref:tRNA1(Val) (adenine(37)-N6)-methyltransferase n=1 Tax=Saccharicrinis aurantiacus TaxID=1849719 RepID=UPI002491E9E1|nr:methyltransferase [Saccharicrinis aurantiacus]
MANTYFQFKEFTIHQDKAAMKVGTDGVLLGAWTDVLHKSKALDIGTGTGLIAIMLAQRSPYLNITAIDIDKDAVIQAQENVKLSLWNDRISISQADFTNYVNQSEDKFDLIVSNPPFFTDSLKNECDKKSAARHNDSLSFQDLTKGVARLLTSDGSFCVVLPSDQQAIFTDFAKEANLFLNKELKLKPTPTKMEKRVLLQYSFQELPIQSEVMIVEEFGRHQYSEAYKKLTKDFYLKF